MTRMVLDAGRRHSVRPGDIVKGLAGAAGIVGSDIGNIDVQEDLAFIEIKNAVAGEILEQAPVLSLHGIETKLSLVRTTTQEGGASTGEAPSRARMLTPPPVRKRNERRAR